MLNKMLSTTLRDKATAYNRIRKGLANTPLNRQGHVIAGSPGTHAASCTFKLARELPNPKPEYFTLA